MEQEIEANTFAIELILEESLFRREVTYELSHPSRQFVGFDLLDDPLVAKLARKFVVSEQLLIIRLCQLGYFEPYVRGR